MCQSFNCFLFNATVVYFLEEGGGCVTLEVDVVDVVGRDLPSSASVEP